MIHRKAGKRKQKEQREKNNKIVDLNPNISITVLHVNGLSISIKKRRMAE